MKHIYSLLLSALLSSSLAFSQITFSASDILNLAGTTLTFSESSAEEMEFSPGIGGPDQTWNLDSVSLDSAELFSFSFELPENTPFADSFPTANFVQMNSFSDSSFSSVSYDYVMVTDSAYISIGDVSVSSFEGMVDTTFDYYSDTAVYLPIFYERSWTQVVVDSFEFFGTTDISIDTTEYFADAYGSITVPTGTYETLRLRAINRSANYSVDNGVHSDTTYTGDITYIWLAKEVFFPAQITGPEGSMDPNFTEVEEFLILTGIDSPPVDTTVTDTSMTDTTGTDTALTSSRSLLEVVEDVQISPNPVGEKLTLSFNLPEKMPMDISIYDLRGRKVHSLYQGMLKPGAHAYSWDGRSDKGKSIQPGWYVAVMRSGERGHGMKFLWRP